MQAMWQKGSSQFSLARIVTSETQLAEWTLVVGAALATIAFAIASAVAHSVVGCLAGLLGHLATAV